MQQGFRLILASGSPRRHELLARMGYAFESCVPDVDERVEGSAGEVVQLLAERKARAAASRYGEGVIIASDTLVSLNGQALGKPADEKEAFSMLHSLSGRQHEVYTGICLLDAKSGRSAAEVVCTFVQFRPLTDEEISAYVATGEPMDKAGAYGIQGQAGAFVAELKGSYENVMGFPVQDVERMLGEFTKDYGRQA